jgi:hypothetical protein
MAELELERASGDRRLYMLGGVGSIRFEGLLSRNATAESNGERLRAAASRERYALTDGDTELATPRRQRVGPPTRRGQHRTSWPRSKRLLLFAARLSDGGGRQRGVGRLGLSLSAQVVKR